MLLSHSLVGKCRDLDGREHLRSKCGALKHRGACRQASKPRSLAPIASTVVVASPPGEAAVAAAVPPASALATPSARKVASTATEAPYLGHQGVQAPGDCDCTGSAWITATAGSHAGCATEGFCVTAAAESTGGVGRRAPPVPPGTVTAKAEDVGRRSTDRRRDDFRLQRPGLRKTTWRQGSTGPDSRPPRKL